MFKNTWKLYEYIDKNHGKVIVEMMWDLGWSEKKVFRHLKKLIRDGLVKMVKKYTDCLYYPTSWKELINWDEYGKENQ